MDIGVTVTSEARRTQRKKPPRKVALPKSCPGCGTSAKHIRLVPRGHLEGPDTLCSVCHHDFDAEPCTDRWVHVADECPNGADADAHRSGALVHIRSAIDPVCCVHASFTGDAMRVEPVGGLPVGWRTTDKYRLAELYGRLVR